MKYPLDELLDKRSIIQLKIERLDNLAEKERLKREICDYTSSILEYVEERFCTVNDVEQWHKELYEINGQIWGLEADIRKGRCEEMGLEEVGRRAIEIRKKNGVRVGIKSKIVDSTGIGYRDIKINHGSCEELENYKSKP